MHIAASPRRLSDFTLSKPRNFWRRLLMGFLLVGVASPVFAGYREDHIELFRITLPSTTTDHILAAEFEQAGEVVVGWQCGNLDALIAQVIEAIKPDAYIKGSDYINRSCQSSCWRTPQLRFPVCSQHWRITE